MSGGGIFLDEITDQEHRVEKHRVIGASVIGGHAKSGTVAFL